MQVLQAKQGVTAGVTPQIQALAFDLSEPVTLLHLNRKRYIYRERAGCTCLWVGMCLYMGGCISGEA
jgi:hypothetical protein